jgi:hypothetical protein
MGLRFVPGTAVTVLSTQEGVCDLPSWRLHPERLGEDTRSIVPAVGQLASVVPLGVGALKDAALSAALESMWHVGQPLPPELREDWFKQLSPEALASVRKHCRSASVSLKEVGQKERGGRGDAAPLL